MKTKDNNVMQLEHGCHLINCSHYSAYLPLMTREKSAKLDRVVAFRDNLEIMCAFTDNLFTLDIMYLGYYQDHVNTFSNQRKMNRQVESTRIYWQPD